MNQYRVARDWIVPRQSRHFAATRVEFCGFCATRYTLLLAKSRPKGLVHSDGVKRDAEMDDPGWDTPNSQFLPPRLSLNESSTSAKTSTSPMAFFRLPPPHPPSRDSHFSWRKNSKMGIDKFSTLYGTIDILIYSMTFFFNRDWKMYGLLMDFLRGKQR